MCIESLTGDEFMNLDAETHRDALEQYGMVIETYTYNLGHQVYESPEAHGAALDKLTSLLTLRKLHKNRLAELEEDELEVKPTQPQIALALAQ